MSNLETIPSLEKEPQYKEAVFGHWFHEFDRDQLFTYFLALKAGAISKDTPFSFVPKVSTEDLADNTKIIIEGVPDDTDGLNDKDSGNFDNDPTTDAPAAAMFYRQFQREFPKEFQPYATDINRWITAAETGKEMKRQLKNLNKGELDLASTKIFYGLKHQYGNDTKAFMDASLVMLENLMDPERTESLSELYKDQIALAQQVEAKSFTELKSAVQNTERFKVIDTSSEVPIAYFDTRGLNAGIGGPSVAMRAAQEMGKEPQIMLMIDDAKDDDGNIVGNKILLKIPKSQVENMQGIDLRTLLIERLHHLESLFGKGYVTEYGGHAGVIGSDREKGSGLNPEALSVALTKFFEIPRYTAKEFEQKALSFAQEKLGIENVLPGTETPRSEYALPERVMRLTLPGFNRVVEMSESDLPMYEKYFTENLNGNIEAFRALLLEKTQLSEPMGIANYRAREAGDKMYALYNDVENTPQILNLLNDLNPSQIEGLSPPMQMKILQNISQSPEAIDMIWNKDNLTYRITTKHIPDWLKSDIEKYKAARYSYMSLPHKIDEYLVKSVLSNVVRFKKVEEIKIFADTLIAILSSPGYKETHHDASHDQLLHSFIRLCSHEKIMEIPGGRDVIRSAIEQIKEVYGASMNAHWQRALDQYVSLFRGARKRNEELDDLFDAVGIEIPEISDERYHLEFWNSTAVIPPSFNLIDESLKKQEEEESPIITVLIQTGRNIRDSFLENGSYRSDEYELDKGKNIIVGSAEVHGHFKIGRDYDEDRQMARLLETYAQDIFDYLEQKGSGNAKIRFVTGGFPGMLSRKVTAIFTQRTHEIERNLTQKTREYRQARKDNDEEAMELIDQKIQEVENKGDRNSHILNSLVFTDYNMQDASFYDSAFLEF